MSPRLVSTLAVAGLGFTSLLAIWFATRERPSPDQATPADSMQQDGRAQGAQTAPRLDAPQPQIVAPAATPAASPARDAGVVVTPLFNASTPLEALQPATLRFRARRIPSGNAATGIDLSISVVQTGKPPLPLAVREIEGGVYEAGFVPSAPGEFMALFTTRGQPTRSVPLIVARAPGEAGDLPGSSGAMSAGDRHRGIARSTTHRGR